MIRKQISQAECHFSAMNKIWQYFWNQAKKLLMVHKQSILESWPLNKQNL